MIDELWLYLPIECSSCTRSSPTLLSLFLPDILFPLFTSESFPPTASKTARTISFLMLFCASSSSYIYIYIYIHDTNISAQAIMLHRYIRLRTVKGYAVNDASNAKYYRRVLISRCHITLHPLSDPTIFKSYRIRRRKKKEKERKKRRGERKEERRRRKEKKRRKYAKVSSNGFLSFRFSL